MSEREYAVKHFENCHEGRKAFQTFLEGRFAERSMESDLQEMLDPDFSKGYDIFISGDDYDWSLEIYLTGADYNTFALSKEQTAEIFSWGMIKFWINFVNSGPRHPEHNNTNKYQSCRAEMQFYTKEDETTKEKTQKQTLLLYSEDRKSYEFKPVF